jgi:hypothetical protein
MNIAPILTLPVFSSPQPVEVPEPDRENFYCQPQSPIYNAVNASTGYNSEIADDLPDEFSGEFFNVVSVHVVEWNGSWHQPQGITLNFYYSECPPDLDPDISWDFDWDDIDPVQVYDSSEWNAYRVTAILPETLEIHPAMSMGAQVRNDWGQANPLCGIGLTNMSYIFGCSDSYWDAAAWGYYRWTPSSGITGVAYDFAYCLAYESMTGAVPLPGDFALQAFPNPMHGRSSLHFHLASSMSAKLSVYDLSGREVRRLVSGPQDGGPHQVDWDGCDENGQLMSAGLYLLRLEAGNESQNSKLLLIR